MAPGSSRVRYTCTLRVYVFVRSKARGALGKGRNSEGETKEGTVRCTQYTVYHVGGTRGTGN